MSSHYPFDTWLTASALTDPRRSELGAILRGWEEYCVATPAVAAALWWKQYSWYVTIAAVEGWMLGSVPDLLPPYVPVRISLSRPHVTVRPGPAEPLVGGSAAHFARWFRQDVLDTHLDPLVERLHELTRVGRRVLWGSVAHAIAYPLAGGLSDHADVLAEIGTPLDGLVSCGDDGSVERNTCCLAFRMGEPTVCSYCPIRRTTGDLDHVRQPSLSLLR
jgi:hypothetical protein